MMHNQQWQQGKLKARQSKNKAKHLTYTEPEPDTAVIPYTLLLLS